MSATAITMSEFVKKFKEAKTDDERAVAILDLVKQSQNQAKEETLKEIRAVPLKLIDHNKSR